MTESTSQSPSSLNRFLNEQGVLPSQWDLLLFGDGSGSQWKVGGGFACFMVDGRTARRDLVIGARTRSTVSRMELSVYIEALAYHYYRLLNRVMEHAPYRVRIFSDSELAVKCGNREYARKTNVDLWAGLDALIARGYEVRFTWVPRNSTPFHALADELAGKARMALSALQLPDDELYVHMPWTAEQPADASALVRCSKCRTPRLAKDEACPICGHATAG